MPWTQIPLIDELAQNISVEACAPAVEARVLRCHPPFVAMDARENRIQRLRHPRKLYVIDGHRLDRQRAVGPVILTNEAIALQPTSERRLGDLEARDLALTVDVGAVPLEFVARPQLASSDKAARSLAAAPPDQVVGRDIKLVPSLRRHTKNFLDAVVLDRHDACLTCGIEDLGADRPLLDQFSDR